MTQLTQSEIIGIIKKTTIFINPFLKNEDNLTSKQIVENAVKVLSLAMGIKDKHYIYKYATFLISLRSSHFGTPHKSLELDSFLEEVNLDIVNIFIGSAVGNSNILVAPYTLQKRDRPDLGIHSTVIYYGNSGDFDKVKPHSYGSLEKFGSVAKRLIESDSYGVPILTKKFDILVHNRAISSSSNIPKHFSSRKIFEDSNIIRKDYNKDEYIESSIDLLLYAAQFGRQSRVWQRFNDIDIMTVISKSSRQNDIEKSTDNIMNNIRNSKRQTTSIQPLANPKPANMASMIIGGMGVFTKKIEINGAEHIIKGALIEEKTSEEVHSLTGTKTLVSVGYKDIVSVYRKDTREFFELS